MFRVGFFTTFIVILLSVFIAPIIGATLGASYTSVESPSIVPINTLGLSFSQNKYDVGFKVGTLIINVQNSGDPPPLEDLEELKFIRSEVDNTNFSKLIPSPPISGSPSFKTQLVAKIFYCGSSSKEVIFDSNEPIMLQNSDLQNCTNPYPIIVDLFMVIEKLSIEVANTHGFQFNPGFLPGYFSLEFNDDPTNSIPVNNITTSPVFPFTYTEGVGDSFINYDAIAPNWYTLLEVTPYVDYVDVIQLQQNNSELTVGSVEFFSDDSSGGNTYKLLITPGETGSTQFAFHKSGGGSTIPYKVRIINSTIPSSNSFLERIVTTRDMYNHWHDFIELAILGFTPNQVYDTGNYSSIIKISLTSN